jgi:hypothetical protein
LAVVAGPTAADPAAAGTASREVRPPPAPGSVLTQRASTGPRQAGRPEASNGPLGCRAGSRSGVADPTCWAPAHSRPTPSRRCSTLLGASPPLRPSSSSGIRLGSLRPSSRCWFRGLPPGSWILAPPPT